MKSLKTLLLSFFLAAPLLAQSPVIGPTFPAGGSGSGTVTAVSIGTANGVSGSSSGGATPVLTIVLGAITPSSISINGSTIQTGVQGTDTVLLSAGTVSGTGATLCTDASGGATTVGCSNASFAFPITVSGTTTSGGVPYFSSTTVLTSSAILNTNILVKGGGAGSAPTNSSITDSGTTVTSTDTGGFVAPVFVANGTTAGFLDLPQGTTSSAVSPCSAATSICIQAPTSVTAQLRTLAGTPATGYSYWTNTAGSMVETLVTAVDATTVGTNTYPAAAGFTSGGIPYASSTTALTSSGILNTNILVKGGGAGGAPTNSSITDNGTTVSTAEPLQAAGLINVTTPIRDKTRFVLVSSMTAVSTAGVNIGSTGASNATFSWPVTAANWYDMECKLPVLFVSSATIKYQLVSISGSVTISNVNSETYGNTAGSAVFQDLATIAGTTLATSATPTTGAPGAVSEMMTYSSQFLTSHAGNIGLEFIGNGTNNVQMLLGGECGITQIN